MVVNDPVAELTGMSPARFNAMAVVAYTGSQIAAMVGLGTTIDGQVVYCRSTGSGYTQGHWYGYDSVLNGGTWIDLNTLPDFYDYFNSNRLKGVVDKRSSTKEMWMNTFSGTGAAINNTVSGGLSTIDLVTGTTTTGVAMLQIGGPLIDLSKKAMLKLKFKTPSGVTGQIVKLGVGIDKAGTGPATTNNFGIEYCDGDTDWQIHSANGTNQNNYDTTIAVAASTIYGFTVEFNPGTSVVVTFDDGTVKTKSTNVPSTGSVAEDSLVKLSISNNNGSSTSRTLQIMGAYLLYTIGDPDWN